MNHTPPFDLTPRQKRLVRESFASIGEYADSVVLLFYGRLFEVAPQLRGLFKIEIREQSRKLLDMLTAVVGTLDRFDSLRVQLAELGQRHVGYGVEAAHYEVLVNALMWAFGQALGTEFDQETKAAWQNLLGIISKVMLDGAASVEPAGKV